MIRSETAASDWICQKFEIKKGFRDATVCPKCWKFMVMAAKILDFLLEDMFDFKARMWVFSGRRGVHCWVGDKIARSMQNQARSAIATRLNLFKKNGQCEVTEGRQKITRVPPQVRLAYELALKDGIFEEMIYEQGWLDDDKFVLDYPEASAALQEDINRALPTYTTPQERWHMLRGIFDEDYRLTLDQKDGLLDIVSF